jgi:hypothetical protein
MSDFIEFPATGNVKTTTGVYTRRDNPSVFSPVACELPAGSRVTVLGRWWAMPLKAMRTGIALKRIRLSGRGLHAARSLSGVSGKQQGELDGGGI